MNPGPTTRLRWTSLIVLVVVMAAGSGVEAGTPLAADPAGVRWSGRHVARASPPASAEPLPLDHSSTSAAATAGQGLVELAPAASFEDESGGFAALTSDRGVVLRGWSGPAGRRAEGVRLTAARGFSVPTSTLRGSPAVSIGLPGPLARMVGEAFTRERSSSVAPGPDSWFPTRRPLSGSRALGGLPGRDADGPQRGLPNRKDASSARNPDGASGLERRESASSDFALPTRTSAISSRSPWSLRRDGTQDLATDTGRLAFASLMSLSDAPVLPRPAAERESPCNSGAPLGFEVLEVAFGGDAGVSIQPFVAGRRQDPEAACGAFGRAVQGMAGVQFAAGDAWRCRVQVSQSFVDDVKDRFEKPAFSVSLRRRF